MGKSYAQKQGARVGPWSWMSRMPKGMSEILEFVGQAGKPDPHYSIIAKSMKHA